MTLKLSYSVSGQPEESVELDEQRMLIGTLLSNQIVLRAPDVEPIHALIENEDGKVIITDLGSGAGVILNGKHIQVEAEVNPGDQIQIGVVEVSVKSSEEATVVAAAGAPPIPPPAHEDLGNKNDHTHVYQSAKPEKASSPPPADPTPESARKTQKRPDSKDKRAQKRDMLFSPRKARPSGDVLECVAYWGDSIIDVELFHQGFRGFDKVVVGDKESCHLPAGGEGELPEHMLAEPRSSGFKVRLRDGMTARVRKGGQVETIEGKNSLKLGRRDIVHIKWGALRYFLLFVRPPSIDLPRRGPRDTLLFGMSTFAMVCYMMVFFMIMFSDRVKEVEFDPNIPTIVNVPEKLKPTPVPTPPPKVKPPKPEQKVAEKKTPPKKPPPPKPPKKVKVAKPTKPKKPPKVKVANKPKKASVKTDNSLRRSTKTTPNKPKVNLNKLTKNNKSSGALNIKSKKPDFKAAGAKVANRKVGAANGRRGAGKPNPNAGARKGKNANSRPGVEGPKNKKASGVNLAKLGIGGARVIDKAGPGAIKSPFKNSPGGAGGGAGNAKRTYGLGGSGNRSGLAISGSGGSGFGRGTGGFGSGQGGKGGLSDLAGAGTGRGASGRARPTVVVPAGDPGITGGLTSSEVQRVIKANLNQIRHCYNQLLQRKPNSSGKITVAFSIGLNGRVTSASVQKSSMNDSVFKGCVTGAVRRWPFPKPRGNQPVSVTYPFVLTNK